jgi:hypothetical protein
MTLMIHPSEDEEDYKEEINITHESKSHDSAVRQHHWHIQRLAKEVTRIITSSNLHV